MKRASITIVVWLIGIASGRPAAFSNLDFENPRTPLTLGQVPTTDALPGWHVFAGNIELHEVRYNQTSISTADATLIGPNGVFSNLRIEGAYTSWIYSGIVLSTEAAPGPLSLTHRTGSPWQPLASIQVFRFPSVRFIGWKPPRYRPIRGRPGLCALWGGHHGSRRSGVGVALHGTVRSNHHISVPL